MHGEPGHVTGATEAILRDLMDAAPDAMMVADAGGRVLLANAQAEALFGYGAGELPGRSVEDLVPERFRGVHPGHRERYAREPRRRPMGAGMELQGRRKDGREFPAEISLSPIALDDGNRVTIAAVRDVSASKALSERLRRQNEELAEQYRRAEEASRLKTEFLANMSHELRTPLNAVIGFAQLMYDGKVGPVSEAHQEYLHDILTSSRHLLQLIDGVLDLAKVEAGKMDYQPAPVDLRRILEETLDMVRDLADSRRMAVAIDIDPALDGVVADPGKLKQVLFNYLSNALKFTPEGGRVEVRAAPEADDSFRIEVEDTGIGIPPEDIGRLFVEFEQLDAGRAKKYQGAGLGLALTKRIVEAQGGRVGVRSTPGRGSRFFAVLPRAPRPSPGVARTKEG